MNAVHHIENDVMVVARCKAAAFRHGVYLFVRDAVMAAQPHLVEFFWAGRRFGGLTRLRYAIAFDLRQRGLTWKEVGEVLGLTEANARKGAKRHEASRLAARG